MWDRFTCYQLNEPTSTFVYNVYRMFCTVQHKQHQNTGPTCFYDAERSCKSACMPSRQQTHTWGKMCCSLAAAALTRTICMGSSWSSGHRRAPSPSSMPSLDSRSALVCRLSQVLSLFWQQFPEHMSVVKNVYCVQQAYPGGKLLLLHSP